MRYELGEKSREFTISNLDIESSDDEMAMIKFPHVFLEGMRNKINA